MERLLRPVINSTSSSPAATASSTTYWIAGLSTTGSISLGVPFVAGRKRVPRPAAGTTAFVTAPVSGMLVTLAAAVGRTPRGLPNLGGCVMDRDLPGAPGAPGVPGTQDVPGVPGVAGVLGVAGVPAVPGALGAPDVPGGLGAPDVPGGLERDKAALRKTVLAARALLTPEQRAAAGQAIRDAVLSLPEAQMAGTVAAYYSVATEPHTHGLVYALWKRGTYVLLPVLLADGDLGWGSYEGPDSRRAAPRGLADPAEPSRGVMGIASADLVLLPAVAVDRRGWRLGRGGGSYDRALTRVGSPIPTVALLYDGELLDRVPAGSHDQRVRLVARPSQGITRLPLS